MVPRVAANCCMRTTSATKPSTCWASRSLFIRPASRVSASRERCSPTQSAIRGCTERLGRRKASATSEGAHWLPPVARRSQARPARTAVRSKNSVPTPPLVGTPAAASATCTGTRSELTRVSTAISCGAVPAARAVCTACTVVATDVPSAPATMKPSRSAASGAGRMALATRRTLCRNSVSAARTMPPGQR